MTDKLTETDKAKIIDAADLKINEFVRSLAVLGQDNCLEVSGLIEMAMAILLANHKVNRPEINLIDICHKIIDQADEIISSYEIYSRDSQSETQH